ncbi:MAG: helicase RepA family protein, partial [Clostridiales bacterium]|nr:helicase RepA family protein [Clostridiales bacterium]
PDTVSFFMIFYCSFPIFFIIAHRIILPQFVTFSRTFYYIVSSLIPTGLHILGSAPKAGKSWLALWLCLKVANSENVWNYKSRRGTALYLCLEDSFERIQSRTVRQTDDAPDNVHFAVMADGITDRLV